MVGRVRRNDYGVRMTVDDYILLIEVSHLVQQELNRRALETCELSLQQAAALSRIETAGGRATISQLASDLGRASHSVSGMVTSLEKAALVMRERSSSRDRRQVWVSLSRRGKDRLAAYRRHAESFVDSLNGMVSREEAVRLVGVINALTLNGHV